MITAVDTNVLFDLLAGEPAAAFSSRQALANAVSSGLAMICPVVYAELAAGFASREEVGRFVHDLQLRVDDFSTEALLLAASAWKRYSEERGRDFQCPQCGNRATFRCPACQALLAWRQHVIADFLVGGHASCRADRLLTRDLGYYRAYFPNLRLVSPTASATSENNSR